MSDTFNAAAELKATIEGAYIDCSLGDANSASLRRRGGTISPTAKIGAFNVNQRRFESPRAVASVRQSARCCHVVAGTRCQHPPLASISGMAIVVAGCGKAETVPDQRCRLNSPLTDAVQAGSMRPVTRRPNAVFCSNRLP